MLDVSLNLVAVVAMLFGIVVPGLHIEVDGLNSPTAKPILGGRHKVGTDSVGFKASRDTRGRNSSRILPYRRAMVKAYRSWSKRGRGRCLLPLLARILATLVYGARTFMAARVAVENPRIQRLYPGGIAVGMDFGPERKAEYLQCDLKPIDHRVGVIR